MKKCIQPFFKLFPRIGLFLFFIASSALSLDLSLSQGWAADTLNTDCIGSDSAKNRVIYLHGADTQIPGQTESSIRERLVKIAENLDLRIALPRSKFPCPAFVNSYFGNQSTFCWEEDLETTKEAILNSVGKCFDPQNFGLVGFSTGARFINRWMLARDLSPPLWSVSAANPQDSPLNAEMAELYFKSPLKMAFVIGDRDSPDLSPFIWFLSQNKIPSWVYYFHGGHRFSGHLVEQAIRVFISRPSPSRSTNF